MVFLTATTSQTIYVWYTNIDPMLMTKLCRFSIYHIDCLGIVNCIIKVNQIMSSYMFICNLHLLALRHHGSFQSFHQSIFSHFALAGRIDGTKDGFQSSGIFLLAVGQQTGKQKTQGRRRGSISGKMPQSYLAWMFPWKISKSVCKPKLWSSTLRAHETVDPSIYLAPMPK